MREMTEFRKRQSSTSVNGVSPVVNNLENSRETKVKTLSMQQSLSKRMVMFDERRTFKEQLSLGGANGGTGTAGTTGQQVTSNNGNMLTSFHNNLSKQQSNIKTKHEIEGKYSTSNIVAHPNTSNQIIESEGNKKSIFEEYQERWKQNNKKIFRYLITWQVGDDGKIEDQLKLMITYLSIIFIIILFLCGFATTFYFHQTNKDNIQQAIESQAQTILQNSLIQYKNSTEYIFKGYEFVLNYLSDMVLSKLQISYKVYDFSYIKQFPYKGPNKMHQKGASDQSMCPIYTGNVVFDTNPVSLECIDWYEFDPTTEPLINQYVYQEKIDSATLTGAIDILNYVLESQIFDVFITKLYKIYFGFEYRQVMYGYPGLIMGQVPDTYRVHSRGWYANTRSFHIEQNDTNVYRVISSPYFDAGSNNRVVTISKAVLAPSPSDPDKRYQVGKGLFMGVASMDIKIGEFQQLFQDIKFYETGYLLITNVDGNLLNEPSQFVAQVGLTGKSYEDLSITQLLSTSDWGKIVNSTQNFMLQVVTSIQGEQLVVASTINSEDYYPGQQIMIMLVIPYNEVYGDIDTQNQQNLENILISSIVSLAVFVIATIICMVFVKKKIVNMVSAISELNKCALSLTSGSNNPNFDKKPDSTNTNNLANSVPIISNSDGTHSKREVMEKLNQIQKNSESQTIKELVKGFENQLKGISKLGKGGQNILKNGKSTLKYEQAEFGGTQLLAYVEPLLSYLNMKKEKFDTEPSFQLSNYSSISQMHIKTLTNQFKKPQQSGSNHNLNYQGSDERGTTNQMTTQQILEQNNEQEEVEGEEENTELEKYSRQKKQADKNGIKLYPNIDEVRTSNLQLGNTNAQVDITNQNSDPNSTAINNQVNTTANINNTHNQTDIKENRNNENLNSERNQAMSNNHLLSNRSDNLNYFMFSTKNNSNANFILSPTNTQTNNEIIDKNNNDVLIPFNTNENDTIDLDSLNIKFNDQNNNNTNNSPSKMVKQ